MYIKTLRLENVKAFPELSFDFERPDGTFAGWTVFVGGNSSGKSTLLKAASLALLGPDAGKQLIDSTLGWIRKGEKKATATTSVVWEDEVDTFKPGGAPPGPFDCAVRWQSEAEDDSNPEFRRVPLPKNKRTDSAERGPWNQRSSGWFSAGYGPMRRLTGSSSESMRYAASKGIESRYVTLFREDAALSESEEWLKKTHSRILDSKSRGLAQSLAYSNQSQLLDGVKALLGDGLLPYAMKISEITTDDVFVMDDREIELPMRDISDGCRSIYATILDLVHGLFEVYGSDGLFGTDTDGRPVVTRPGVVIVDEIEAHIHPAWQRDIPDWLKTHFPKIQFLVSSHSPLIAQAADPNGLFILPLQNDHNTKPRPASEVEYEKIRWGSAHKTILGMAFGLDSTRTRWAAQQLAKWQNLNAKKKAGVTLSRGEQEDYQTLNKQIELALDGAPSVAAI